MMISIVPAWLWLAVSWLACVVATAAADSVVVQDGASLVVLARDWANKADSDLTLLLPPGVLSVRNVSFSPAPQPPPGTGRLYLAAQYRDRASVLDAGMRAGMLTVPLGAKLIMEGIVFVNLCEFIYQQSSDTSVVRLPTATGVALLPRQVNIQSHNFTGVTVYTRLADVRQATYLYFSQRTPFPQVKAQLEPLWAYGVNSDTKISWVSPWAVMVQSFASGSAVLNQVLFTSLDNPSDPFLRSNWATANLMPQQFCNGTMLPESITRLDVNPSLALWVVESTQQFATALAAAWPLACQPTTAWKAPPVVMLNGGASLAGVDASALPALNTSLIWAGPFNDDPASAVPAALDLGGLVGALLLAPGAQLFIRDMTLSGLAVQPLPLQPGAPVLSSALPLAAFKASNSSLPGPAFSGAPALWLHNVTLQLPAQDFAALAALALYGRKPSCTDAAVAAQAAQLQAGIQSLQLAAGGASQQALLLDAFVGWGMNATQLWVTPVQAAGLPQCVATANTTGSGSGGGSGCSTGQVVGMVLGCVCGGLLLLLLAALLAGLLLRKKRHLKAPAPGDLPAAACSVHVEPISMEAEEPQSRLHAAVAAAHQQMMVDLSSHLKLGKQPASSHDSKLGSSSSLYELTQLRGASEAPLGGTPGCAACDAGPFGASDLANGQSEERSGSGSEERPGSDGCLSQAQSPLPAAPARASAELMDDSATVTLSAVHVGNTVAAPDAGADWASHMGRIQQVAHGLNSAANQVVIVDKLGAGSSGTVYKGVWRGLPIALKTLVFDAAPGLQATGGVTMAAGGAPVCNATPQPRAIMEAAIAASVGHRNVVCTYLYDVKAIRPQEAAVSEDGGLQVVDDLPGEQVASYKLFLVQELCNMSLSRVLDNGAALRDPSTGRVDFPLTLALLIDITNGLAYLHSKGIIHGDLKPDNILLKVDHSSCQGVVAKLADFGLSQHLAHTATHLSGFAAGTPFYVAPEVVLEHSLSPASDIFSLGVVMWQMCTGRTPYVSTPGVSKTCQWDPLFPDYTAPNMPPSGFQHLTNWCLQRTPASRPSAKQVLLALEGLQRSAQGLW